ncbi:4'-phosphopantetheinyl transferase family protein [Streptomyces bicolor]|uniref:4'-phosphopantetheinyl transferase family protein n=1 Tax=Streptomyces bicolor TaxID=66874 RepID=UPI0009988531|nr:4'-phosphopantetheinyl transferase superfamily protein [Streptomyces bicolor]
MAEPDALPVGGEPLPVGPLPAVGWHAVQGAARRHGYAVCHGRPVDWGRQPGPGTRELLGPDWSRYCAAREPLVRARLLGSRLLLRHTVAAVAGVEPDRVVLGRDGRGRPVLYEPDGLDVAISHTAGMLVVGAARGRPIGVDVEASDRPLLTPGLAERFCHPRELAQLSGLAPAERNQQLVRLWTLKEACTKAQGVGLARDFARLCPRPGPHGDGWWSLETEPGWRLRCDRVAGRFLVAGALGPDGL